MTIQTKSKMENKIGEINPKDILAAIDRELAFYRAKLFKVYSAALVFQLLLITGEREIEIAPEWVRLAIYSSLFVIIAIATFSLNHAYVTRTYHLRRVRKDLLPFFQEPGGKVSRSPSQIYVALIALVSLFGIIVTWFAER